MVANKKLSVGDRVRFFENVSLLPYTVIQRGETGVVEDVDLFGDVNIKLHKTHRGLCSWDNCALLAEDDLCRVQRVRGFNLRSPALKAALIASAAVLSFEAAEAAAIATHWLW